ncbi:proteasome component M29 [Xylographa opegraphella]|nr:proteasome component M29 [Xylographa opegraphella]
MSRSTITETPEAKELALVGKVELRIALTDSDSKLESILNTYLAPLLLKLASDHVSVRNKDTIQVIAVCQHINTRIKPPSVKLPVAALVRQYKDCHNTIVRHFDLLYIQQGIERLPVQERLDLLPALIHGLADNFEESPSHTASLFNVILKLLHHLVLPPRGSTEDVDLRLRLGLDERVLDAEFVASWLGKIILFTPSASGTKSCPGLSAGDCDFLKLYGKSDIWTLGGPGNTSSGMNLTETKVISAKFLSSGAFTEVERFLPALYASADSNSRLSDIGEDMLKRATPVVSLEDQNLLTKLFKVYLGTRGATGSLPARRSLQTKILALFSRSREATCFVAEILQIVKEALEPQSQSHDPVVSQHPGTAPKQGLDLAKLRAQIFAFTNWVARMGSQVSLSALAPTLVTDLRTYIEAQGWPRIHSESPGLNMGELSSRSYCYESIGLLAKACPRDLLVEPHLNLLRWLFSSLSADTSGIDISISIEQALSSMLSPFTENTDKDIENALTDLLLHNMSQKIGETGEDGNIIVRSTRYIAVRFANRCLPFHSVKARLLDVLAQTDGPRERGEVLEEGQRGLNPYWYRNLNPFGDSPASRSDASESSRYKMPNFVDLYLEFFVDQGTSATVRQRLGFGYSPAITFCRCVLLHEALSSKDKSPIIDAEWKRKIDAMMTNDETGRMEIKNYLKNMCSTADEHNYLSKFLHAALEGFIDPGLGDSDNCGTCLLEICSLGPDHVLDEMASQVSRLKGTIFANRHSSRMIASHTFGILASRGASSSADVESLLHQFSKKIEKWNDSVGSEVHEVHGSVLSTAYLLSRRKYLKNDYSFKGVDDLAFVRLILTILSTGRDKELLDAATLAIDQLCLFGTLTPDTVPAPYDFLSLADKLKVRAEGGDENSVLTLGHLAMQCHESNEVSTSALSRIIDSLYNLHEKRQPELQFAVGAALSCAAAGWQSKSLVGLQDVDSGATPRCALRSKTLNIVLERVLCDCKTTKPALRQGSVIWLLCIVQYCGHLAQVQSRLRQCQTAFKGFLADRESLNQETASRGLTLVYEKGDQDLKDDLIRDLVGSFTSTNVGLAGNVSSETQLFEPGALPTGDGSVTTYKDIMSLASEVGDSSLVYRFMSLASNNAIWSSRAAFGRFGLSNILSDSSVDGYLAQNPKLYPALFRYRFDPNTNVRSAMNDIWSALVKDPQSTINEYFDSILEDLLKNILGKEWRVRQASCAAIADLVQGRPVDKYEKHLSRIWALTFKVCDDIKDSVRQAAMALARVLTAVLTRSLEVGDSSRNTAGVMLKEVLPFLLSPSGLESSAQEIQAFSLKTLLQIIKSSNAKFLRPFIPDLVGRLLALLSSLEPQEINYLHLNADKYGMTAQQIDDVRLSSVRSSPMMEAIERCLDMLDDSSMKELQASMEQALRTTIGLPSRVGVSRVLVSLSTRHNFVFKPYADNTLRILRKQVLDRNDTISTSFATASGYVARLASNDEVLRLFDYCKKLYFDSGEDDRHRIVSAELVSAVAKYGADRFASLANDILPFVFVAKHDPNERTKELFNNTWTENVGGSRAVLLYLKEIVATASPHLESPRWSIKHTAAFAIAHAANAMGDEITNQDAEIIWPSLEKALSGKTWDGKELILEAFITFAKNSNLMVDNKQIGDRIQSIVLRESKRNNAQYRQHALVCLGDFVEICKGVEWYEVVYEITNPLILELLDDGNKMDVDSRTGGPSSKITSERTLANALRTLLKSIDPVLWEAPRLAVSLSQTFDLIGKALSRNDKVVKDAILDGETALFKKLATTEFDDGLDSILTGYSSTLFKIDDQAELSRAKAADAATTLGRWAPEKSQVHTRLASGVEFALTHERSSSVRQKLEACWKALGHQN